MDLEPTCADKTKPFVLLVGLGIHSLFEGIALGLLTNINDAWLFALAIFLHKGAAGMSLCISLVKTFPGRDKFVVLLVAIFAACTPLGIGLGMGLLEASDMVELVFNCFAAGTFLYIGCSEVIVHEFSAPEAKYWKLFAFLVGIGIIVSLQFLPDAD